MKGTAKPKIGILAIQGDFAAHAAMLQSLGAETIEVRTVADLEQCDALVLPGGESTTQLQFLQEEGLFEAIKKVAANNFPVLGTCAGAILLATHVSNPPQASLGLLDMSVLRNAYGRQVDSRVTSVTPEAEFQSRTTPGDMEAVFIRAPIIRRLHDGMKLLAQYEGDPVLIEDGRHLVATFHPELTRDTRVHSLFLDKL